MPSLSWPSLAPTFNPRRFNFPLQLYDWNTGLFSCCSDPQTCLFSACCPVFLDLNPSGMSELTLCRCNCWEGDKECYDCCSDCCEHCVLPAMMMSIMCVYSPIVSPCMSGCLRKDFVHDRFETAEAKASREGKTKTKYFQMTNCIIGTVCSTLSNAQILREFIVRGGHSERKKLACSGKGMYDESEWEAMGGDAVLGKFATTTTTLRTGDDDDEILRLEREAKERDEEAERLRRRLADVDREAGDRRAQLEAARRKKEENERFQGSYDHEKDERRRRGSHDEDSVFEMKADTAFGSVMDGKR